MSTFTVHRPLVIHQCHQIWSIYDIYITFIVMHIFVGECHDSWHLTKVIASLFSSPLRQPHSPYMKKTVRPFTTVWSRADKINICWLKKAYYINVSRYFWSNYVFISSDSQVFTARCTLVQSAVLPSHVVCLSVCL